MNLQKTKGNLLLLLATLIWGSAFVAQDEAMKFMKPFAFQTFRSLVGAAVLIPVILLLSAKAKKKENYKAPTKQERLYLLRAGMICGFFLTIAAGLQQVGLDKGSAPGKAGFITALYMFFVPIFGLFLKKKPEKHIWLCIVAAAIGMYFLCIEKGAFAFAKGDLFVLGGAFAFGFQILAIDHYAPRVYDCIALAALQFFFCGVFSILPMFLLEPLASPSAIVSALPYILYVGVLSNGVAYTLQVVGQKMTEPTIASLIMSFESVFAMLTGIIVPPHDIPNGREIFGCVLMFLAILAAQISFKKRKTQD